MKSIDRRGIVLGVISSLFTWMLPAQALSKPSIKCRYLGQTTVYKNRIFTCISLRKNGKTRLVWDSGKAITPTSITHSPSSAPTTEMAKPTKSEFVIALSLDISEGDSKLFVGQNRFGEATTYVISRKYGALIAMTAICTHNGCVLKLESDGLLCPCHNALFKAQDGEVLRGPAAHPLDRVFVREESGMIFITD